MDRDTFLSQFDFGGDVVCVTGGAGGIGMAISQTFASLGADVALVDVAVENATANARSIREEYDVDAIAIETDVTSYDDARAMVGSVEDGLGPIDVLVNNAGVAMNGPFARTDPAGWKTMIGVALYGTLNCTHAALGPMLARGTGAIINFASASYRGNDPGLAVYGAAKAANVSFTKTLAKEVGSEGIRVNCVSPGTVRTPATEEWLKEHEDTIAESYALERIGEPEEVASVVTLLSSEATGWVTGEVVHVDGGYLRR